MATLGAPAGAAAEDGGYDGRHEEHESLAVLAARYGSGSESEGEEGERAQHSGGGGGSEAAQPAPPHGAAQQQQHQPACEAAEALAAEEHGDYDEDYDADDYGDALDWLDRCDDLEARGIGGGGGAIGGAALRQARPNANGGAANQRRGARGTVVGAAGGGSRAQPRANALRALDSRVHTGRYGGRQKLGFVGDEGLKSLPGGQKVAKARSKAAAVKDKSDRATVEQVLDPRTRMVLFKLLNRGVFSRINGCVSTGKEANVYHAASAEGEDLAIKIYKTSILVFKDRARYVQGDHRFQNRTAKGNPRQMVKTWAEKEMRNLLRLKAAGVRCPTPVLLRMHVLVMDFIGDDGWAAPRLRDAGLSASRMAAAYDETVRMMRVMYHKCRLVHGDLSEYNMLYHEGHVYIIDVSQSVEHEHPRAFDFLREDCLHVRDFFSRGGVATMDVRELFDFVTDPSLDESEGGVDAYLDAMKERAAARPADFRDRSAEEQVSAAVFHQVFIPKTLNEVANHEREQRDIASGRKGKDEVTYARLTGMGLNELQGALPAGEGDVGEGEDEEEDDYGEEDEEGSDGEEQVHPRDRPAQSKEEQRAARKAHKAAVKEANREKRKDKVPKKVKAQAQKRAKARAAKNSK